MKHKATSADNSTVQTIVLVISFLSLAYDIYTALTDPEDDDSE